MRKYKKRTLDIRSIQRPNSFFAQIKGERKTRTYFSRQNYKAHPGVKTLTYYVRPKKETRKKCTGLSISFCFPPPPEKELFVKGAFLPSFQKSFQCPAKWTTNQLFLHKKLKRYKNKAVKGWEGRAKTLMAFLFLWEICEARTFPVPSCPHTVEL